MPRYNPCQDTQHHQHIHPVSNQAWADNVIFLFPHSSTLTQRSVPGPPLPKEAPTIHPLLPKPHLEVHQSHAHLPIYFFAELEPEEPEPEL